MKRKHVLGDCWLFHTVCGSLTVGSSSWQLSCQMSAVGMGVTFSIDKSGWRGEEGNFLPISCGRLFWTNPTRVDTVGGLCYLDWLRCVWIQNMTVTHMHMQHDTDLSRFFVSNVLSMPSIKFVKHCTIAACFSAGRELMISSRSFAKCYHIAHTHRHIHYTHVASISTDIFQDCLH